MSLNHRRKEDGIFPLYDACRQGNLLQVKHLLKSGSSLTATDADGCTPLHCASASNQESIIRLLLNPPHSCSVDIHSTYYETPLHLACLNGHKDTAKLLLEKEANLKARDGKGNTVLHHSAASGTCDLIHWIVTEMKGRDLLDSQNMDSDTPLHLAGRLGCHKAFSTLCTLGANLDLRNKWDRTPLEEASLYNNCQTFEKEEETRRNNLEGDSYSNRVRSQSEPKVGKKAKKGKEDCSSQSATCVMSENGNNVSPDRTGTSNSDHKPQGIPQIRKATSSLDSKSASHIGIQKNQSSATPASRSATNMEIKGSTQDMGTPSCTYRGTRKTGKYELPPADRVSQLRGLQKSQSEKLHRRKDGMREKDGVTPNYMTRDRTHSDKFQRNVPESLV